MNKSMKNAIIVGVAIAVIGGLSVIIIGEPIKAWMNNLTKSPQIVVEDIQHTDNAYVGRSDIFVVNVLNQGNTVALNCNVYFDDGIKNYTTPIKSGVFSIIADDKTQPIQITSRVYTEAGTYNLSAYVSCDGIPHSNTISRSWTVPT